MNILIIEDNEVEMENLKILLEGFEGCTLIGSADTIKLGIELANRDRPDLILLDIQLECENSLDHIHKLDFDPCIICCTLYDKHALQAFEVGVTDYLTKPITHQKLDRALSRLPQQEGLAPLDRSGETIPVHNGTTVQMIKFNQIVQITSDGDYTTVRDQQHTEFLCTRRMHEWAELLPASLFSSLDRSVIINRKEVASFSKLGEGRTATITFQNEHTLKIGATALRRLKTIVG